MYDAAGTCTHENNGVGVSHETMINGIDIKDIPVAELKAMTGSRPEYLIMPATFGIWMMFMVVYLYQYELRLPCIQLASESPFPREKT